jgi:hypothetical protein
MGALVLDAALFYPQSCGSAWRHSKSTFLSWLSTFLAS